MISKDILEKTGLFNEYQNESDYNYWLRALKHTNCVYIEDICFYYKS